MHQDDLLTTIADKSDTRGVLVRIRQSSLLQENQEPAGEGWHFYEGKTRKRRR